MKKFTMVLALAAPLALAAGSLSAQAAGVAPTGNPVAQGKSAQGFVHEAKRKKYFKTRKRIIVKRRTIYRPWHHRPHYGRFIAGVTLGTILAVAIANTIPPPPAPDLCWYWSNRAHTHGYWDYCY